jgi:hypothetical protein
MNEQRILEIANEHLNNFTLSDVFAFTAAIEKEVRGSGEPVAYLYSGRDTNKVGRVWASVSGNDHWPIDQWEDIKQELLYLHPAEPCQKCRVMEGAMDLVVGWMNPETGDFSYQQATKKYIPLYTLPPNPDEHAKWLQDAHSFEQQRAEAIAAELERANAFIDKMNAEIVQYEAKCTELECKLSEEREITQRLALELDAYHKAEYDMNVALNSGDGAYRP